MRQLRVQRFRVDWFDISPIAILMLAARLLLWGVKLRAHQVTIIIIIGRFGFSGREVTGAIRLASAQGHARSVTRAVE